MPVLVTAYPKPSLMTLMSNWPGSPPEIPAEIYVSVVLMTFMRYMFPVEFDIHTWRRVSSVPNPVPVIVIMPLSTGEAEVGEMDVIDTEESSAVYSKLVVVAMEP